MDFCSRASIAAQEPCAGTGVRADAYVFLPVAKRHWRDREMNREWASDAELAALRAARPEGVVTRLYNPPEAEAAILVHGEPSAAREPLQRLLAAFAGRWRVDAAGAPRLAICTHGTRDRCCAKWGFAAFQAARELFLAGRSAFEPIECSHLGGDRFAATGVFFPSGSMYAHLDQGDLAALCAQEAQGRVRPQGYRGRVFEPPLTQTARAGLAAHGLLNDARAPITVAQVDADTLVAETAGRRYRLALTALDLRFFGDCAKLDHGKRSHGRRLVVERVEELDPDAPPQGELSRSD
jgi:hypothetical protein